MTLFTLVSSNFEIRVALDQNLFESLKNKKLLQTWVTIEYIVAVTYGLYLLHIQKYLFPNLDKNHPEECKYYVAITYISTKSEVRSLKSTDAHSMFLTTNGANQHS